MKKFTVFGKFYNDMGVLKVACRSTDDLQEAIQNLEDYENSWKYISVRVAIDGERAGKEDLYNYKK